MRKAITALTATALLFGVTAASAQTTSSGEGKPSVSKQQRMKSPGVHRSTTGAGSTGMTPGSNPNPDWNKNPDPEVPGHPE
jgi:hypothetical protein